MINHLRHINRVYNLIKSEHILFKWKNNFFSLITSSLASCFIPPLGRNSHTFTFISCLQNTVEYLLGRKDHSKGTKSIVEKDITCNIFPRRVVSDLKLFLIALWDLWFRGLRLVECCTRNAKHEPLFFKVLNWGEERQFTHGWDKWGLRHSQS